MYFNFNESTIEFKEIWVDFLSITTLPNIHPDSCLKIYLA